MQKHFPFYLMKLHTVERKNERGRHREQGGGRAAQGESELANARLCCVCPYLLLLCYLGSHLQPVPVPFPLIFLSLTKNKKENLVCTKNQNDVILLGYLLHLDKYLVNINVYITLGNIYFVLANNNSGFLLSL